MSFLPLVTRVPLGSVSSVFVAGHFSPQTRLLMMVGVDVSLCLCQGLLADLERLSEKANDSAAGTGRGRREDGGLEELLGGVDGRAPDSEPRASPDDDREAADGVLRDVGEGTVPSSAENEDFEHLGFGGLARHLSRPQFLQSVQQVHVQFLRFLKGGSCADELFRCVDFTKEG